MLGHNQKPPFDSTGRCLLPKLTIDQITFKQFRTLIMLMWKELADDYGGIYLDFEEGKWINLFDIIDIIDTKK